jgi:hypothetical protein
MRTAYQYVTSTSPIQFNQVMITCPAVWNPLSWAMEVAALLAIILLDYADFALVGTYKVCACVTWLKTARQRGFWGFSQKVPGRKTGKSRSHKHNTQAHLNPKPWQNVPDLEAPSPCLRCPYLLGPFNMSGSMCATQMICTTQLAISNFKGPI